MAKLDDMTVTVRADVSEMEAELDRMIVKAKELRRLMRRPWWCPRWLYNFLNDGDV